MGRPAPTRGRGLLALALLALTWPLTSDAEFSGTLQDTGGRIIVGAFVGLMSPQFEVKEFSVSGGDGRFRLQRAEADDYVLVQPPTRANEQGLAVFNLQPRIYRLAGEESAVLQLPPVGCLVLKGYDASGGLMRYGDYLRRGTLGGQFVYATDLAGQLRPAACWWIHDEQSGGMGAQREKGLPALAMTPGDPRAVQVMFWDVRGYGKLMLRADNGGEGFLLAESGDCVVVELNVELARTAVDALARRAGHYGPEARTSIEEVRARLAAALAKPDESTRAAAADGVLAAALRLRDDLEYAAAQAAIPTARKGEVQIRVHQAGAALPGCRVEIRQLSHAFLFGIFEGGPHQAATFERARDAGFELATLLFGWSWTEPKAGSFQAVDDVLGVSSLKDLGFQVKAHGVIYLQEYGIMPERAERMDPAELPQAALDHQKALLNAFTGQIDLWEAVNEPGCTNSPGLPPDAMTALTASAARNIKEMTGKPVLVNSQHETNYGMKYLYYGPDNQPAEDYPVTYSEFLERADAAGALEDIDVVGLQFYPGFHMSEMFAGLQGPAVPPAWLVDTIDRYARFGKPVHLTEFSIPSAYAHDGVNGFWREKWSERIQAEYADFVYTLAFGNPHVHSVTWWDFSAANPAVRNGSLLDKSGKPKPALERIARRIAEWTTQAEDETDADGTVAFTGFAGEYEVAVTGPSGARNTQRFQLPERDTVAVSVELGEEP